MGYFQVRYDSRVVIYDGKMFIRLATGCNGLVHCRHRQAASFTFALLLTVSQTITVQICTYLNNTIALFLSILPRIPIRIILIEINVKYPWNYDVDINICVGITLPKIMSISLFSKQVFWIDPFSQFHSKRLRTILLTYWRALYRWSKVSLWRTFLCVESALRSLFIETVL